MAFDNINGRSHKIIWFTVFLAVILILSSCSKPSQLPDDARNALHAYWQSLPTSGVENHIKRAWPGTISAEVLPSSTPTMEIWCVEAEISSKVEPSINGELLIWIVMRENKDRQWSAALLASMSSTWPYEACGRAP
ncbi:hypothetical protein ACFLTX_03255 [Chloroflexota bacterium]